MATRGIMPKKNFQYLQHFKVTCWARKWIIVSGGNISANIAQAKVYAFDCLTSSWIQKPLYQMNVARFNHSTTCREDLVFVACGTSEKYKRLSSIEFLDMKPVRTGSRVPWQLIDDDSFVPRIEPVICCIDSDKLAILGGTDSIE